MSLLECFIGIALCGILLAPLLQTSAQLAHKQIEFEKTQLMVFEAERALELIGRAIRIAGYRNIKSMKKINQLDGANMIVVQKRSGYQGSDSLTIRHELSDGIDFDCLGNILSADRTKKDLALQGFMVDRQAGLAKGAQPRGGSLICQSLDRQGRLQNTTLMSGVGHLNIEELAGGPAGALQRVFRVKLEMTDGAKIHKSVERTFSTRNPS
ncbi:hypothetical protein [Polynucleobacter necessarius]|uniref:hypothetical protein n=1 Tax=Polynucleobacter necessarius TaxID=576610 RepID=UPI000E09093D|nr:hypothetical protein [Polynucleobacter necessarius]